MTKTKGKTVEQETAPAQEAAATVGDAAAALPATLPAGITTAAILAAKPKLAASDEVMERCTEAVESLAGFANMTLPGIKFKDGFTMGQDQEDVESFEGIIVYTKESNVYYKDRFKAGEKRVPDCLSPDGKTPLARNGKDGKTPPQASSCAVCPKNQYGSSPTGDGKACKNTRPVFVLVTGDDGTFGVIPKVLRVPPTSLGLIKGHIMTLAADFGAYYSVKTRFTVFKRSEDQTHNNIKFTVSGRLTAQEKTDVRFVRDQWLKLMSEGDFSEPEVEASADAPQAPKPSDVDGETRF